MALLVASYLRWQFMDVPLERDEGEYCYQAQLLLEGKIPYLDFYEQKPPGLFYSYAWLQAIFGNHLYGVHLGFLFVNLLSIVFIFQFSKNLFDPWAAVATSWIFTLVSLNKMAAGFSAQAEHLLILFFLAALCVLQQALKKQKPWLWILGAALLAWTVLIKQNGIFYVGLGMTYTWSQLYLQGIFSWKSFSQKMGLMFCGALVPVLWFGLQLYRQAALSEMFFWMIEYPRSYIGQYHWETGWRRFLKNFQRISTGYESFWYLAASALLVVLFTKKTKFPKLWFYLLPFFSLLAIIPGFRFYGHYFLLLFPSLAILVGLGFYLSRYYLPQRSYPALPLTVIAILVTYSLYQQRSYYFELSSTELLRSVYQTNPFSETKLISDYLKQHSEVGDQIAVWGSEPQINFYTNRKAPSRHNFLLFLMGNTPQTAIWQRELIAETSAASPRYIVDVRHPYSGAINKKTLPIFYPWRVRYLETHYEKIGLVEIFKDQVSRIYWGELAREQAITSPYQLVVYERKP